MAIALGSISTDNEQVRVTTWTFAADGDATGRHRHEFDYVVVPVTGGTFRVTGPDGSERELAQAAGVAYAGAAGTTHDVTNISGCAAVFVEVELKEHPSDPT
jgi:quercetin dioxygenase-like cupin family protein